jgi:tetratricopeptide (TPR) repeat protein
VYHRQGERVPVTDIADAHDLMANLYISQTKYAEALELYEKGLAIRKEVHGLVHPDVGTSYHFMAAVYKKMATTPIHPDVATSYRGISRVYEGMAGMVESEPYTNMGKVWRRLGLLQKALEMFKQRLASCAANPHVTSAGEGAREIRVR